MAFVVKVKFENTLRRLTVENGQDGRPCLNFAGLIAKIREMFKITLDEKLVLTYVDQDNDMVAMSDDDDLHDAWFIQNLSPLRIYVNVGNTRIQESKEARNNCILSNLDANSIKTLFSSPICNGRVVKNMADNQHFRATSSEKVEDGIQSYRLAAQTRSNPGTTDELTAPASFRFRTDPKMRKSHFTSYDRKHYPRMKGFQQNFFDLGKLDARFVCDITVFDGTEVAVGTPFTKIWRLRNVGTCPWPQDTRLVQTGGDFSGMQESASVEMSKEGLLCEEEVNVAADFVAPDSPGRYVSHWRLQAPSGQKFGQRVWVLVKVVSKCMDSNILNTSKETTSCLQSLDNGIHLSTKV